LAQHGDCTADATIGNIVEVLKKGAVSLAAFPYKAGCQVPPASLIESATDFRVKDYRVLDRSQIDEIKAQLERGNPVIAVFRVSAAFKDLHSSANFDEANFTSEPGEEVMQPLTIVGYDDERQAACVMNSWGSNWGDHGYAWITYPTLINRISGAVVLELP
jgi:C1A family cysteine protease